MQIYLQMSFFFRNFEDTDAAVPPHLEITVKANRGIYTMGSRRKIKAALFFLASSLPSLCKHKRERCH